MGRRSSKSSGTPPEPPLVLNTDLLYAPHGEPGHFFNPWAPFTNRLADVLRWKLGKGKKQYDKSGPLADSGGGERRRVSEGQGGARLGDLGGALGVRGPGRRGGLPDRSPLRRARALLPRRLSPPGIPLAAVPPDAFAVLSHNHYDHLDAWSVRHLPATMPWFVPLGLGRVLPRPRAAEVTELDWWQSVRHGRWTLTCLPAQHWSNRFGVSRNASLWCWLAPRLRQPGATTSPATPATFTASREIGRRFAPIDVAFLPIGAYEPRWFMRAQHANPEEGYQAFLDLGARTMVPMHWGCFDLTDEPVDLAPKVLEKILAARPDRDRVRTMAVGERWGGIGDA